MVMEIRKLGCWCPVKAMAFCDTLTKRTIDSSEIDFILIDYNDEAEVLGSTPHRNIRPM